MERLQKIRRGWMNALPMLLGMLLVACPLLPGRCCCTESIVCFCSIESHEQADCCCGIAPATDAAKDSDCCTSCYCSDKRTFAATQHRYQPEVPTDVLTTISLPELWPQFASVVAIAHVVSPGISHNRRQSQLAVWLK